MGKVSLLVVSLSLPGLDLVIRRHSNFTILGEDTHMVIHEYMVIHEITLHGDSRITV